MSGYLQYGRSYPRRTGGYINFGRRKGVYTNSNRIYAAGVSGRLNYRQTARWANSLKVARRRLAATALIQRDTAVQHARVGSRALPPVNKPLSSMRVMLNNTNVVQGNMEGRDTSPTTLDSQILLDPADQIDQVIGIANYMLVDAMQLRNIAKYNQLYSHITPSTVRVSFEAPWGTGQNPFSVSGASLGFRTPLIYMYATNDVTEWLEFQNVVGTLWADRNAASGLAVENWLRDRPRTKTCLFKNTVHFDVNLATGIVSNAPSTAVSGAPMPASMQSWVSPPATAMTGVTSLQYFPYMCFFIQPYQAQTLADPATPDPNVLNIISNVQTAVVFSHAL